MVSKPVTIGARNAARMPMFGAFRKMLALSQICRPANAPPAAELLESMANARRNRRQWLQATGISALGMMSAASQTSRSAGSLSSRKSAPRIVIVGAGIAGLNAAYLLKQAGYRALVFEGSPRAGGRILSVRDVIQPGCVSELGGEFINSDHKEMLRLARAFELELIDLEALHLEPPLGDSFFFQQRHHTEKQVIEALGPILERLTSDYEKVNAKGSSRQPGLKRVFDRMSVSQYLDLIGVEGWIRALIEVAYVAEFGLD